MVYLHIRAVLVGRATFGVPYSWRGHIPVFTWESLVFREQISMATDPAAEYAGCANHRLTTRVTRLGPCSYRTYTLTDSVFVSDPPKKEKKTASCAVNLLKWP